MKLSRLMKRTLAVLAFLFVSVFGLVIGLGVWVYLYPLNAWHFAQSHFLPEDLTIEWSDLRASVDHVRGLNWDIEIVFDDLMVAKLSPMVAIKIDQMKIAANATVFSPKTQVHIQNFIVKSNSPLIIKTQPDPSAEPLDLRAVLDQITSQIETLRGYQERIAVDMVDVELADFRYGSGDSKPLLASVKLSKADAQSKLISFDFKLREVSTAFSLVDLNGTVDLADYETPNPFLKAVLNLGGPEINAKVPLAITFKDGQLSGDSQLDVRYKLKTGWLTVKPKLDFRSDRKELNLHLLGDVSGVPGPIPKLQNVDIVYNLPFDGEKNWLDSKGHISINAPIPLYFVDGGTRDKVEASCQCKLVKHVDTKIGADIWLGRLLSPGESEDPAIAADLRTQDVSNAIFAIKLGATLDVIRGSKAWLFKPTIDSQINIHRFQDVREILAASRVLVPAPFSVLKGKVDITAKSPVEIHETTGRISAQAKLSTDLNSPRQEVKVDTILNLAASADLKTIEVDVDAKVHSLQVELPPLDPVKGLPRLVHDSRIQLEPIVVSQKQAVKLLLSFKVETTKKAAIRLLYPLADPYIPISVSYAKEGANEKGSINIEAFKIKYLKRVVFVDSLKVSLNETADADFPIDGQFHVNQTNYVVNIRVAGTTQKPSIDLSSDPYLGRADIVSVLLFDRIRENLVGGDAETSGNAQAAMADKAVGLFGLWAFASTPIRSVSYNSVTKEYSATIVLGTGLTAGIGTSFDQYTSLEIRKRLSKRWVIATSWKPSEANDKSGEVVLQWEKRY